MLTQEGNREKRTAGLMAVVRFGAGIFIHKESSRMVSAEKPPGQKHFLKKEDIFFRESRLDHPPSAHLCHIFEPDLEVGVALPPSNGHF